MLKTISILKRPAGYHLSGVAPSSVGVHGQKSFGIPADITLL